MIIHIPTLMEIFDSVSSLVIHYLVWFIPMKSFTSSQQSRFGNSRSLRVNVLIKPLVRFFYKRRKFLKKVFYICLDPYYLFLKPEWGVNRKLMRICHSLRFCYLLLCVQAWVRYFLKPFAEEVLEEVLIHLFVALVGVMESLKKDPRISTLNSRVLFNYLASYRQIRGVRKIHRLHF